MWREKKSIVTKLQKPLFLYMTIADGMGKRYSQDCLSYIAERMRDKRDSNQRATPKKKPVKSD